MILDGMEQLLGAMGATVDSARDRGALLAQFANGKRPDIILADYHLDDGDTGINATVAARQVGAYDTPCIIVSADDSDVIRPA